MRVGSVSGSFFKGRIRVVYFEGRIRFWFVSRGSFRIRGILTSDLDPAFNRGSHPDP